VYVYRYTQYGLLRLVRRVFTGFKKNTHNTVQYYRGIRGHARGQTLQETGDAVTADARAVEHSSALATARNAWRTRLTSARTSNW
jgi:hypothetical protein